MYIFKEQVTPLIKIVKKLKFPNILALSIKVFIDIKKNEQNLHKTGKSH